MEITHRCDDDCRINGCSKQRLVLEETDHPGEDYAGYPVYAVASDACCHDCGAPLSDNERIDNQVNNYEQDGNSIWCDVCATKNGE